MAIYINICHRKPLISWLLNDETRRKSLTREDFSIKLGSGCKQTAAPQSDAGLHHDGKKNIISHYNGQGPLYVWLLPSCLVLQVVVLLSTSCWEVYRSRDLFRGVIRQSQWTGVGSTQLALIYQRSLFISGVSCSPIMTAMWHAHGQWESRIHGFSTEPCNKG